MGDPMIETLFLIVGGVLVALVAGCFSYLNLVVSKEQKISEFRDRWINSLRDEIAAYVAGMSHLASTFSLFKQSKKPAAPSASERLTFISANAALYEQVRNSATRIVLRINPNDPDDSLRALNQKSRANFSIATSMGTRRESVLRYEMPQSQF